jgi:hypothetical protein
MTHKPEYHSQGQFTQDWPQYQQLVLMDETQVEIYLQDVMTPADEKDLDIAKEMLTRIGIQC